MKTKNSISLPVNKKATNKIVTTNYQIIKNETMPPKINNLLNRCIQIIHRNNAIKLILLVMLTSLSIFSCKNDDDENKIAELEAIISQIHHEQTNIMQNLETFDTLDFEIFTHQKWSRLHESHDENIIVNWPNGRITEGIETHIEDLKFLFIFAPDTRILTHPIRIGSENYTAVMGIMEGTFTKPMPLPNGEFIQPTGKSFKIPMSTIGIWENGVMIEEFLFWDNKSYNDQIGI